MPPKHARTDAGGKRKPHNRSNAKRTSHPVRPQAHRKELSVNKIKSQLRRVRFLLSKDSTGADVRLEAERQEAALLADLKRAEEHAKVAHTAQRYHKVKFIERTKVERQVAKLKRRLAKAEGKEKKALEAQIVDARVLLYYILTFPPEQKYVSLLKADLSSAQRREAHANSGNAALKAAMDFHQKVRTQFEAGELEPEPEVMLSERYQVKREERKKERKAANKPGKARSESAQASEDVSAEASDSDEDEDEDESSSSGSNTSDSSSGSESESESESESDAPPPKRARVNESQKQGAPMKDSKAKPKAKASSPPPQLKAVPPTIEGDDFFDL